MTKYAMFSKTAKEAGAGTVQWKRADGSRLECTAVEDDPKDYEWPDAIVVGEVVEFDKVIVPPSGRFAQMRERRN